MVVERVDPIKRAEIVLLRGLGYSTVEIAEKLGISHQLVSYHLSKLKERAEKLKNPYWAFLEVILQAGPAFPLFSIINNLKVMKHGRNK